MTRFTMYVPTAPAIVITINILVGVSLSKSFTRGYLKNSISKVSIRAIAVASRSCVSITQFIS